MVTTEEKWKSLFPTVCEIAGGNMEMDACIINIDDIEVKTYPAIKDNQESYTFYAFSNNKKNNQRLKELLDVKMRYAIKEVIKE